MWPACKGIFSKSGVCILATADKKEDECELPGCQKPKRKEGTRVHDYCCADHAQKDAPNREGRFSFKWFLGSVVIIFFGIQLVF